MDLILFLLLKSQYRFFYLFDENLNPLVVLIFEN